MGKGKRRNTAKTGDKALYKNLAESRSKVTTMHDKHNDSNDNMYNSVDQYHNQRDEEYIKLNGGSDNEPEDSDDDQEAVMDLGVGGNSSEEDDASDDDDDDDDDDDSEREHLSKQIPVDNNDPTSSSSDEDEEDVEDVRDWGRKKSAYYHGDTADLELGQDEEDAFLEEDAAKEVQAARLKELDEADFVLSDDDEDEQNKKSKISAQDKEEGEKTFTSSGLSIRDISKLNSKDRRKLLEKRHPGLQQILSHFIKSVHDLRDRTSLATRLLFEGENDGTAEAIGCTTTGKKYLLTKTLLQATTALNLAMFLLLKCEEGSSNDDSNDFGSSSLVQFHPVMKRLQEWNVLTQKLKENVEGSVHGLDEQLDSLIKAAELMDSLEEDSDEVEMENEVEEKSNFTKATNDDEDKGDLESSRKMPEHASSSSDDDGSSMDEDAAGKIAMYNARFGIRPNEVGQQSIIASERKERSRRAAPSDLGDGGDEEANNKDASRYLASTINTIEQRQASRKKVKVKATEEIDSNKDVSDDLRRGLDMMEEELGKESDEENGGDVIGAESDDDDDAGFYTKMAKKSKEKRENRKSLYAVAPKFPRMEGNIDGERPIGRMIMKNRGLVAHKNKLNRNPRVKKREQYRKALIRRKGTVREVRTDEGHKYGGEETGIKSRISRSRKLGTT